MLLARNVSETCRSSPWRMRSSPAAPSLNVPPARNEVRSKMWCGPRSILLACARCRNLEPRLRSVRQVAGRHTCRCSVQPWPSEMLVAGNVLARCRSSACRMRSSPAAPSLAVPPRSARASEKNVVCPSPHFAVCPHCRNIELSIRSVRQVAGRHTCRNPVRPWQSEMRLAGHVGQDVVVRLGGCDPAQQLPRLPSPRLGTGFGEKRGVAQAAICKLVPTAAGLSRNCEVSAPSLAFPPLGTGFGEQMWPHTALCKLVPTAAVLT
jgi:hypothetical protein